MITFPDMTTAREVQRNYRKLFDFVKKTKRPMVVMRNNKPDVAIVDYKSLQELEATIAALTSREEARQGKTKVLRGSLTELWHESQKTTDN